MKTLITASLLVISTFAVAAPNEETPKGYEPKWGFDVTSFRPSSQAVRELFGQNWTFFNISQGTLRKQPGTTISWDSDAFVTAQGETRREKAFLGSFGLRAIRVSGNGEPADCVPFYGVSANLIYQDVTSRTLDFSAKKLGYGGSIFAGVNIGKSALVQLRYQWMSRIHDVDFSGVSLNVGIRF